MIRLMDAVDLVEARKEASMGCIDQTRTLKLFTFEARALFTGYDIDFDELRRLSTNVGSNGARAFADQPLPYIISSAWVDGLMVGLACMALKSDE